MFLIRWSDSQYRSYLLNAILLNDPNENSLKLRDLKFMAFYCDLFVEETKSAVNTSETAKGAVEDLVIFALRINIEDTDDKNEVAIVNFQLNDFVISVEGNGLNLKWKKLFSKENIILKKLLID